MRGRRPNAAACIFSWRVILAKLDMPFYGFDMLDKGLPMPKTFRLDFEQQLVGKHVLVTGHTGFTGSWACEWLTAIGARVTGLSLAPETHPALYQELRLSESMESVIGDIRDAECVTRVFERAQPDFVLHLAAQPLVRRSYREPVDTFSTNVMGTVHVLEAARHTASVQSVVCVTTDKVYLNKEWEWPYRENDALGGKDPYSASKAAAEMVIQSYSQSFPAGGGRFQVATARGGNIIGGGDWSEDRLIPDFVRAVVEKTKLTLRYPDATRPWQHVLALVQGYLMLLAALATEGAPFARAWNLGPQDPRTYSVRQVLTMLCDAWQSPHLELMDNPLPEARALALDSSIARNLLQWSPPWDTQRVVTETANWYRAYYEKSASASEVTRAQIASWRSDLAAQRL